MNDYVDQSWNVRDEFKGMSVDEIKLALKPRRQRFISVFENLSGDYNKATGCRNHNAFCGQEIWFVGNKKWDKRGAVGTYNYEDIRYFSDWEDAFAYTTGPEWHGPISSYEWVAVDNVPGAEPLDTFLWSRDTIMVYGEEKRGLSDEALSLCDRTVYIPMLGSVRSLNVGTASGIIMHSFVAQTVV